MSIDTFLLSADTTDLNYPEIRPTLDLNFARVKALDPRITFTRASGGSYVGADGLIKYAGVNEPRFDHNPVTGESLGFLVEESRTNLELNSNNFSESNWIKSGCSINLADNILAPDGTITANKIVESVGLVSPSVRYSVVGTNSGTIYTISVYAKSAGRNYLSISAFIAPYQTAIFNLSNGTVTASAGNSCSIISVGNGWYRCIFVISSTGYTGGPAFGVGQGSYTGDGTSGIYIWGAQIEAGAFPTSYIPTVASSRTRAAESASITGKNFRDFYRQDEGTLYLKTKSLASTSAPSRRLLFLSSSSSNDPYAVELNFAYSDNIIVASRRGLNANVSSMLNNPTKVSFAWNMTGSALSVDGQSVNFTSGTSTQRTFDVLQFGYVTYPSPDGTAGNIYMERITYYPKRLTNQQLQVLTR